MKHQPNWKVRAILSGAPTINVENPMYIEIHAGTTVLTFDIISSRKRGTFIEIRKDSSKFDAELVAEVKV